MDGFDLINQKNQLIQYLEIYKNFLKSLIINSSKNKVGLLFYNTALTNNKMKFKHIF